MPESRIDQKSGDAHGVRRGARSRKTLCAATCGTAAGREPEETAQLGRLILAQQSFRPHAWGRPAAPHATTNRTLGAHVVRRKRAEIADTVLGHTSRLVESC